MFVGFEIGKLRKFTSFPLLQHLLAYGHAMSVVSSRESISFLPLALEPVLRGRH